MTPRTLECPKCGANWPLIGRMLAEVRTFNKDIAEQIRENCSKCKENFVQVLGGNHSA